LEFKWVPEEVVEQTRFMALVAQTRDYSQMAKHQQVQPVSPRREVDLEIFINGLFLTNTSDEQAMVALVAEQEYKTPSLEI
jgi:hypothetical protein